MNEEFFRMFINERLVSMNTELNEENNKLLNINKKLRKNIKKLEVDLIWAGRY